MKCIADYLGNSLEERKESVDLLPNKERRHIFFGSHKQIQANWEQPGSNLPKQIQRIQAEWDSATYRCCGKRNLYAEIFGQFCLCKKWCSSLPYVRVYHQAPANLTLPCWLWLPSFTSDLICHCRLSGHQRAVADPGYQHRTCSAFLIWVL